MIRLNEATLWYEVLVNPEACCMKWTSEADYIMPILTPKFLREIHGQITGDSESLGLLPTSPILNKYMYNLARSRGPKSNVAVNWQHSCVLDLIFDTIMRLMQICSHEID